MGYVEQYFFTMIITKSFDYVGSVPFAQFLRIHIGDALAPTEDVVAHPYVLVLGRGPHYIQLVESWTDCNKKLLL